MENIDGGIKITDTTGDKIKQARIKKFMTQEELGKKLGLKQKQISRYETNNLIPPTETLIKISEILDVSIDYLLADTRKIELTQRNAMHKRERATSKPQVRGLSKQQLQILGITEEMNDQEQTKLLEDIQMNTANKPPARNFSKQQQELIEITDKMTDQQQAELLGAVKMFLTKQ